MLRSVDVSRACQTQPNIGCAMNLFLNLHKWARSQDENFTTDAFVCVLDHLTKYERRAAGTILGKLFGCLLTEDDCDEIRIETQKRANGSQPDICIERRNRFRAFIEVKVEGPVDWAQLKRHRNNLDGNASPARRFLVLLTRDADTSSTVNVDSSIRWHEVAEWLAGEIEAMQPVGKYLSEQFIDFLRERKMTIEQVRKELILGVLSFENLLRMLEQAVTHILFERSNLPEDGNTPANQGDGASISGIAVTIGTIGVVSITTILAWSFCRRIPWLKT